MGSLIITNAHRINQGEFPKIDSSEAPQDFYFIQKEDPNAILETILDLITHKIPSRFGMHPINDIQVLTPMHKGIIGTANLNAVLQDTLNPGENGLTRGGRIYRQGDKVMQIENDYEREIFNGDIGRITKINKETNSLEVQFDDRIVQYEFTDLDELLLAYSVSIHKSQGTEYPAIIMPVHTTHYVMLQRNLIYTGLTRAKKLAILAGTKRALAVAVKNDKTRKRFTRLEAKLRDLK